MGKALQAIARLQKLIESERFPLNSRLPPERELAQELRISRGVLRSALAILEAEGKIWRHVGKGTFVGGRPVNSSGDLSLVTQYTSPAEVLEVRLLIEPRIAGVAALKATAADIDHMRRCLAKIEHCYDSDGSSEAGKTYDLWDGTLHRAVAEAAHNTLLLTLFDALNAVRKQTTWGRLQIAALNENRHGTYCQQHRAFVDAIAARDSARAELLMHNHVETVRLNLMATSLRPEDGAKAGAEPTDGIPAGSASRGDTPIWPAERPHHRRRAR